MKLLDTHAHYCDGRFNGEVEKCLENAFLQGVEGIVTCPSTVEDTVFSAELAEKYPQVYFAAGIHPEVCGDFDLGKTLPVIEQYLSHPKCVAVGECGLDYYWPSNPSKAVQREWFEAFCDMAVRHGMPIIVHDREAHADTLEILKKYRPKGVLHCYSGSVEMAREFIKLGLYLSFTGVITFANAEKPREVLKTLPLERIMFETDCPYLAPVPYRGKRNESAYMVKTVEAAAKLLCIDVNKLAEITTENAYKFFEIGRK